MCARVRFNVFGRVRLISGPIGLEKVRNDVEFSQVFKTIEKTAKFDHETGAREKTRAYARAPKMRQMSWNVCRQNPRSIGAFLSFDAPVRVRRDARAHVALSRGWPWPDLDMCQIWLRNSTSVMRYWHKQILTNDVIDDVTDDWSHKWHVIVEILSWHMIMESCNMTGHVILEIFGTQKSGQKERRRWRRRFWRNQWWSATVTRCGSPTRFEFVTETN